MNDATLLAVVAMLCLTVLGAWALFHGIDHFFLALVVTVIAGLGGYELRKRRENE